MLNYRNAPIRRKLLIVLISITGAALAGAGLGILFLDTLLFRTTLEDDLSALARIVADNSTAAVDFDDPTAAAQTLGALRARPHMVTACIFLPNGARFASYRRPESNADCVPPRAADGIVGAAGGFIVSKSIEVAGRRVATLTMLYDNAELYGRAFFYGGMVGLILLVSCLIAAVVSRQLRDLIASPISRLAGAAARVSESGDYSVRAVKETNDELGILVDSFNQMLERIQVRDVEVQNARTSLETTLTSIGDAVVATDTDGVVTFANPVAASLLGWPRPELVGKRIDDVFRIVNEYTRQPVESPVARVLREGTIVGLANHTILTARDGTRVPIDDSAAPIRQSGCIAGVVLVFRDITERRRAQQDAAYLAAIVESSDDAIIGRAPDGVIQTWNAGAERVYGYSAKEAIGTNLPALTPPERRAEEAEMLERLRGGTRLLHFETTRVRKDGVAIDLSLTFSPILDRAGQIVGISEMGRDITQQKRTAEQIRQTQKLESLGVLAGGIAHDFNNLLTGILGNASLAMEDVPEDSSAREALKAVVSASERAAQLARQMLAYSGKGRFLVERIDLSERIREIIPLIKGSIPAKVELRLNLDGKLPPIEADAAQIQQLVMNVIINGGEAIGNSPGTLTVTTRTMEVDETYLQRMRPTAAGELSPGPHVVFEVADTGCGMDQATLGRIFDPFFTTKFTGRGLGLAAVLGIVRGHHGSVEITSAPGKGTTFCFLFPAAVGRPAGATEASAAPAVAVASAARKARDLRGSATILVVDDEPVVRSMARHSLEHYGYTVLQAENGAEALEIFHANAASIRCVVLDLTMPVMSGEETLERLKSAWPSVPVILSSGFNEAQAVQRFEGKGLAGFLQKPYRASALLEKISAVLPKNEPNTQPAHPASR